MKTISIVVASLLYAYVVCTLNASSIAVEKPDDPSITWCDYSSGISVATILTSSPESVGAGQLKIYLKNTSTTEKDFYPNGFDEGVRVFYQNSEGIIIPIHDYSLDQGVNTHKLKAASIQPGEILCITIDLNAAEFQFLKTFPFKYELSIFDPANMKSFKVDSQIKKI